MKTLEEIRTLGINLTGLEITTQTDDFTCLFINYDRETFNISKIWININEEQIEKIYFDLLDRGLDPEYLYLQALLHEFAHYKQVSKLGLKKYIIWAKTNFDYMETVADRFAKIHYRKFLNRG